MRAFFISVPHSGEQVPEETPWLEGLEEPLLMFDVDRYVDLLYRPIVESLKIPWVVATWHRYVVDLNRLPSDVDEESLIGSDHPKGAFTHGFHWVKTTAGMRLMKEPISRELHDVMVEKYFDPFHRDLKSIYGRFRESGAADVYHIDAHSMPSRGTEAHRDKGEERAQVVISDVNGKSCSSWFRDLVVNSYKAAGFSVSVNWPYLGGRITQSYGCPEKGQQVIQVELNRSIYMDEVSKKIKQINLQEVQSKLSGAVKSIYLGLPEF